MPKPEIAIVNEDDEIIGYKDRGQLNDGQDIYRVSALWITDKDGNILLAQRAFNKKHHPGKFGPAVAGTVEKEEDYLDNIIKEAEEELGLKNVEVRELGKYLLKGEYCHFTKWFGAVIDKETNLNLQEDEVASVRWFSVEELRLLFKTDSEMFLESLIQNFDKILEMSQRG